MLFFAVNLYLNVLSYLMKLISHSAEARIFDCEDRIIKERSAKSYRAPALDLMLRKFRTRREAKVLEKLHEANFSAPQLIEFSDETMTIRMQKIPGKTVRDSIANTTCAKLGRIIGEKIGILHSLGVIHGDLTTSNMIFSKDIYFIDFGLSFFSNKAEDRAVDLHLFKQALAGTHPKISEKTYLAAILGYKKTCKETKETFERLVIVEQRGRNKKNQGS